MCWTSLLEENKLTNSNVNLHHDLIAFDSPKSISLMLPDNMLFQQEPWCFSADQSFSIMQVVVTQLTILADDQQNASVFSLNQVLSEKL